jgi:hypothetical protein
LVRSLQPALGIRRYVQTHRVETPLNEMPRVGRGTLETFEGVAELWWDNLDALVSATSSSEGSAAGQTLLEDETKFIDLEQSTLWLGQVIEIIPLVPSPNRGLRQAGLDNRRTDGVSLEPLCPRSVPPSR